MRFTIRTSLLSGGLCFVGLGTSSCAHGRAAVPAPQAAATEWCWSVMRMPKPSASIVMRFSAPLRTVGFRALHVITSRDTTMIKAGPDLLAGMPQNVPFLARVEAYPVNDSLRVRFGASTLRPTGGWRRSDDSASIRAKSLQICTALSNAAH